jgi:hypothetical protein
MTTDLDLEPIEEALDLLSGAERDLYVLHPDSYLDEAYPIRDIRKARHTLTQMVLREVL